MPFPARTDAVIAKEGQRDSREREREIEGNSERGRWAKRREMMVEWH